MSPARGYGSDGWGEVGFEERFGRCSLLSFFFFFFLRMLRIALDRIGICGVLWYRTDPSTEADVNSSIALSN